MGLTFLPRESNAARALLENDGEYLSVHASIDSTPSASKMSFCRWSRGEIYKDRFEEGWFDFHFYFNHLPGNSIFNLTMSDYC